MLNDCKYNKIKLLRELSSIVWFIDKWGISDAEKANDTACVELLRKLHTNLDTQIKELEQNLAENS